MKTEAKLNFEGTGTANCADDDDTSEVTVTATDPSGAATTQDVTIAIENENEAPNFQTDIDGNSDNGDQAPPTVLYVAENQDGDAEAITYRPVSDDVALPDAAYS